MHLQGHRDCAVDPLPLVGNSRTLPHKRAVLLLSLDSGFQSRRFHRFPTGELLLGRFGSSCGSSPRSYAASMFSASRSSATTFRIAARNSWLTWEAGVITTSPEEFSSTTTDVPAVKPDRSSSLGNEMTLLLPTRRIFTMCMMSLLRIHKYTRKGTVALPSAPRHIRSPSLTGGPRSRRL